MTTPTDRPLRLCDSCLIVDDEPRHVVGLSGENEVQTYTDEQRAQAIDNCAGDPAKLTALLRDLPDVATSMKHLHCCLSDGCPTGSCQARLTDPADPFDGGKTTGAALNKKMEAFAAKSTAASQPGGTPHEGLTPVELFHKEDR